MLATGRALGWGRFSSLTSPRFPTSRGGIRATRPDVRRLEPVIVDGTTDWD